MAKKKSNDTTQKDNAILANEPIVTEEPKAVESADNVETAPTLEFEDIWNPMKLSFERIWKEKKS